MQFEWDSNKAAINLRDHKVSLSERKLYEEG